MTAPLRLALSLIALSSILLSSCATSHVPSLPPHVPPVKVKVNASKNQRHLEKWGTTTWSQAAYLTRNKLKKVEARDPETIRQLGRYFEDSSIHTIHIVEQKLQQMDRKFHQGNCTICFFEHHETPGILLSRNAGAEGVNAYTIRGSNTLHINQDRKNIESVRTIIHEMSHMAAYTHDFGYRTIDGSYWSSERGFGDIAPHEKIQNADTYSYFILGK